MAQSHFVSCLIPRCLRRGILFLLLLGGTSCADLQDVFNKSIQVSPQGQTATIGPVASKSDVSQTGLAPGQREPIVTKKGVYYFVAPGDSLSQIAQRYNFAAEQLAQINDLFDSSLVVGRRIFIPNKKTKSDFLDITEIIKKEKIMRDSTNSKIAFIWPVDGFVLTSPFGWRRGRFHAGLDLSDKPGTPVHAAASGQVIYSKRFAGYGNLIVIKHVQNYYTAYAHTQTVFVNQGSKVKKGQQIALVGSTGRSSGPHLHFEIHKGADAIDPITLMPPVPRK